MEQNKKERLSFIGIYQKFGVFFILIIELVVFGLLSGNFFTSANLFTIGKQVACTGIAAVGCTFVMIMAGIDLSVGAMLAVSGILTTWTIVNFGWPMGVSIVAVLVFGFLVGMFNGFCYVRLNISPLIATLATQYILKGIAFLITDAKAVYGLSDSFKYLGQGKIFGFFPFPLLVMFIIFIFGYWVLNQSYIGRYIYAVGGNVEAARLSGINTNRMFVMAFAVAGLLASFAGVIMAARLGSGQPNIGNDFPMDIITAVVLGGVSLSGGSGKITGVLAGTFIMGILSNGMVMINISEYVQWVIKGSVLIFAVAMSNIAVTGTVTGRGIGAIKKYKSMSHEQTVSAGVK